MTSCLRAASRVISLEENIVEAEPIAPLGAAFVEHVERRTIASHWKAKEKAHNVELEEGETSEEEFFYWVTSKPEMTSTVNSVSEPEIYAQMPINEQLIKFHIDCSVTVNVLPIKYVNKEDIHLTKRVLQLWNNTELKPEGICRVTIRNPQSSSLLSTRI